MCGHVGIAGVLESRDEATMKRLFLLDYFRGPDSTGLAALRKTGEVKIAKIASHPLDFFDTKSFTSTLSAYNSTVLLGHNRAATRGKVNGMNAHPYEYGHIVGAHNGTLDLGSWQDLEQKLGHETDVDSMAIFECIEKFGIEATVPLLRGAWALVWIDTQQGTLNFLRNKERDFWYAYTDDFKKLFWASEWPMIRGATDLAPSNYDMFSDKEGYRYFATATDWLYSFDLEELKNGYKSRPTPMVKELKGKEPLPVVNHYGTGGSPFQGGTNGGTWKKTNGTNTGTTGSSKGDQTKVTVLNLAGDMKDPFAGCYTERQFNGIATKGCDWCGEEVNWGDVGVTVYQSTDQVLCPTCSVNPKSNRIYATPVQFNNILAM